MYACHGEPYSIKHLLTHAQNMLFFVYQIIHLYFINILANFESFSAPTYLMHYLKLFSLNGYITDLIYMRKEGAFFQH